MWLHLLSGIGAAAWVMDWNDLMAEKGAWYGHMVQAFFSISGTINEGGFYSWLSGQIQKYLDLSAVNGMAVLVILLLISFVTKYFFVSMQPISPLFTRLF